MKITLKDINELARPCYVDEPLVNRCIVEAEDVDLKGTLGASMLQVLDEGSDRADVLLNGGSWGDGCGIYTFKGVKTAWAYYAWARALRASVVTATRFGAVVKQDDYSRTTTAQERQQAYGEAFAIGDKYLAEVVAYLNAHRAEFPEWHGNKIVNQRNKVKVLGI